VGGMGKERKGGKSVLLYYVHASISS